jgi:hypothetical protein
MFHFLTDLALRNKALFVFGLLCFISALIFFIFSRFSNTQVSGINAWIKPIKFALSIGIYAWTMGWLIYDLPKFSVNPFNISIIVLLGFELIYIAFQASQGQLSHFNLSTPITRVLYFAMAMAATLVTIYTAYVGIQFFVQPMPTLPDYFVWSIRIGIFLFCIFSLEGFVMGSKLSHTIGGPDGGPGLPFLNWSVKYGDPRIPHFIGMHALQILPLLSWYVFKNTRLTFLLGGIYFLLAIYTLWLAFQGKPLIKIN